MKYLLIVTILLCSLYSKETKPPITLHDFLIENSSEDYSSSIKLYYGVVGEKYGKVIEYSFKKILLYPKRQKQYTFEIKSSFDFLCYDKNGVYHKTKDKILITIKNKSKFEYYLDINSHRVSEALRSSLKELVRSEEKVDYEKIFLKHYNNPIDFKIKEVNKNKP